ncbi:3-hydroxyacyl-[acyl-carrier-protein] dehydratase, mitochondrial [Curcuma longa]|uniref:3-hydroxyacyl-[acyl-carrier-protein] dehydratase, mitochondrial n=1 Tax=Curcuma longa TaxID=136217 RepID=UPI003D9E48E7
MTRIGRVFRIVSARPGPSLLFFSSRCSSSSTRATARLLRVGDVLRESRRFSESDVAHFSEISGDHNPIHLDDGFARDIGCFDRGRVVHGMLVASLFSSVIASHVPGSVYVSQTLKFISPVYIGDEVLAEVEATYLREHKKRYIVKFTSKCLTNGGSLVIDGETTAILPTLVLLDRKNLD